MLDIGYFSLPVVGLTAIFTGMVLALQSYTGFARFSAESAVATVVVLSVTRELGPVIAGLMVAGRVGAAMAAEIGTMRVTDQIDALTTLSTDPLRYLVLPRLLAGLITLPLLVLVADIIGVFGGYLVGVYKFGFNPEAYLARTEQYLETSDVVSGLVKAAVFGFIVALMGCYHGYHSRGGAQGVGQATTYAVVSASILILVLRLRHHPGLVRAMSDIGSRAMPKISVRGLRKSFGRNRVLDGIDIDCMAAESLVIIGGSGTGKSVLVKCILGLLRPDAGSVAIDGVETVGLRHKARERLLQKCGMLFQGSALFELAAGVGECRVWVDPGSRHGAGCGEGHRARQARCGRARPRSRRIAPGRAVGRHAKARRIGARDRRRSRNHLFRRADHRARPDHGRRHQRSDREMQCANWARPRSRSPTTWSAHARSATASRCCTRGRSSGMARRPRSIIQPTLMSINSSTAVPRGRFAWRSARYDGAPPDSPIAEAVSRWPAHNPALPVSNAARFTPNGPADAMAAAPGTA